jgi:hypothetical protein
MRNMNAHHDLLPEPNDESRLEEVLSSLKRLEPPLEARIANRQAVSAALSSMPAASQQRHLPWWRRTVSIPVPLATALGLLVAVATYSSIRNWQQRSAVHVAAPALSVDKTATAHGNSTAIVQPMATAQSSLKFYGTETYLCGVGRVSSESYYVIKE